MLKNLIPGQYQIGETVFGNGTTVPVEVFDIKPDDLEAQDFKVSRSDEIRFGQDSLTPTTIDIQLHVLHNWAVQEGLPENFWKEMPTVEDFKLWFRADDVRQMWGEILPIYCCGKDGITRLIWGRPGPFTYAKSKKYESATSCMGQFRRADTLTYTAEENFVEVQQNDLPTTLVRPHGDVPSWFRILATGPMTNPVFTVGEQQIELGTTIPEGVVVEISSYPWRRRVVDSKRQNLGNFLTGKTPYLDKLKIPLRQPVPIRWTSDEVNTWVPALGNSSWMEDIQDQNIWDLDDEWETLAGQASVRFDLFNFGSTDFPWISPSKYLAAVELGGTTALIYKAKKYNTANQYSQAKIVEPWNGRSGIVIMSTPTMSSFVVLEVQSGLGANYLRIKSGTGWNSGDLTTRATWQNTALLGWKETDIVGIGYDPPTKTYQAYFNGEIKATWNDSTDIVPTGTNNRSQGHIFNMDGIPLLTTGTGFRDIIGYDREVVPAEIGKVVFLWRDAWSTVR